MQNRVIARFSSFLLCKILHNGVQKCMFLTHFTRKYDTKYDTKQRRFSPILQRFKPSCDFLRHKRASLLFSCSPLSYFLCFFPSGFGYYRLEIALSIASSTASRTNCVKDFPLLSACSFQFAFVPLGTSKEMRSYTLLLYRLFTAVDVLLMLSPPAGTIKLFFQFRERCVCKHFSAPPERIRKSFLVILIRF